MTENGINKSDLDEILRAYWGTRVEGSDSPRLVEDRDQPVSLGFEETIEALRSGQDLV